jgi:hypothetical protein
VTAANGDLVASMRRAGSSWTSARGIARHWRDQDLVTEAFHRRSAAMRAAGMSLATFSARRPEPDGEHDPVIESVYAVAADHGGWRRRVDLLSWHGAEMRADSVVLDGPTFWARTGTAVTTNDGDPNMSHGGTDIVSLLVPSEVPDHFTVGAAESGPETVAGRACVPGTATPLPVDPHRHQRDSELFFMISGGTDFRLSVDSATGVLLRVVKLVDGRVAEVCEFQEITFDEPLDPTLFAPL